MIRSVLLAAVLVLGSATQTLAAPATPPAARSDAEMGAYLGQVMQELGAYAGPHQAAIIGANDLVLFVIDGSEQSLALHETRPGKRKGAAWADQWQAQLDARIAVLQASRSQLPVFPEATFDKLETLAPDMAAKRGGYAQISVQTGKTIDVAIAFAANADDLIRRVAQGDDDALAPLGAEMIRAGKLMLTAENATLDIAITTGSAEHPQTALSRSMKSSNIAMELFLDHRVALMLEEDSSPQEVGAKMRVEAAAARKAALLSDTLATRVTAQLKAMPDVAIKPRLLAMAATYHESSAVEVRIAEIITRAADAIARGDLSDDQLDKLLEPLDPAIESRIEIATRRLKLLNP